METPMTLRVASTTKLYMRWETYRAEADECRRMATKALDPVDKERWLRVAEQWLDLIPRPLNRELTAHATVKPVNKTAPTNFLPETVRYVATERSA
jgi:hypothetical protein